VFQLAYTDNDVCSTCKFAVRMLSDMLCDPYVDDAVVSCHLRVIGVSADSNLMPASLLKLLLGIARMQGKQLHVHAPRQHDSLAPTVTLFHTRSVCAGPVGG
jgi:hypothetical protein